MCAAAGKATFRRMFVRLILSFRLVVADVAVAVCWSHLPLPLPPSWASPSAHSFHICTLFNIYFPFAGSLFPPATFFFFVKSGGEKKVIDIYVWIILGLFSALLFRRYLFVFFPTLDLKANNWINIEKKSATACVNSFSLLTRLNNVSGQDSCRRTTSWNIQKWVHALVKKLTSSQKQLDSFLRGQIWPRQRLTNESSIYFKHSRAKSGLWSGLWPNGAQLIVIHSDGFYLSQLCLVFIKCHINFQLLIINFKFFIIKFKLNFYL